jgi:hypothetical protein
MGEMRYGALFGACVLGVAASGGFASATGNSSTWEGQYQGTVLPTADGFGDGNPGGAITSVSGGFFHFNTTTTETEDFYYLNGANDINFATGASLEFTMDINQVTGAGGCDFVFDDSTGKAIVVGFEPGDVFVANNGVYDMNFSGVNTYRLTVLGSNLNFYVDNNPTPVVTGSDLYPSNGIGNLYWGDVSGGAFSNFDLESMSWTNQGAFAPVTVPEPTTFGVAAIGLLALMRRRRSQSKAQ